MSNQQRKLRTSGDVISRLRWSEEENCEQIMIGYHDRVKGPMEKLLSDYKSVEEGGDLPQHRILYFRRIVSKDGGVGNESILWARRGRVDRIFGSGLGRDAPVSQDTIRLASDARANMRRIEEEKASRVQERHRNRLTLEDAQQLLQQLQQQAPPKVRGRRPTEKEVAAQSEHNGKVNKLLQSFPETIRRKLGNTRHHQRPKKNKDLSIQPAAARGHNSSVIPCAPCSYEKAVAKPIHYLAILDFEATCNNVKPRPLPQEIIEFPTILVNTETGRVESIFHTYVKPDVNPTLTPFCTELTGIRQSQVDNGVSLPHALRLHQAWLAENNVISVGCDPIQPRENSNEGDNATPELPKNFVYVACGNWDLQTCLPNQLRYCRQAPDLPGFAYWINIKKSFTKLYRVKAGGMAGMLRELCLKLRGRHHSGIDDCKNIVRICQRMLQDGWKPKITS